MSLLYLYFHLIIIFFKKIKKLVFLRIYFPIFCFYLFCFWDLYYQYMFNSFKSIWSSHYNLIKKIIDVIVINILWIFYNHILDIDICISVFMCIVIILVCTYILLNPIVEMLWRSLFSKFSLGVYTLILCVNYLFDLYLFKSSV